MEFVDQGYRGYNEVPWRRAESSPPPHRRRVFQSSQTDGAGPTLYHACHVNITPNGGLFDLLDIGVSLAVPRGSVRAAIRLRVGVSRCRGYNANLPMSATTTPATTTTFFSDRVVIEPRGLAFLRPVYVVLRHALGDAHGHHGDDNHHHHGDDAYHWKPPPSGAARMFCRDHDGDDWSVVGARKLGTAPYGGLAHDQGKHGYVFRSAAILSTAKACEVFLGSLQREATTPRRMLCLVFGSVRGLTLALELRIYVIPDLPSRRKDVEALEVPSLGLLLTTLPCVVMDNDLPVDVAVAPHGGWRVNVSQVTVKARTLQAEWNHSHGGIPQPHYVTVTSQDYENQIHCNIRAQQHDDACFVEAHFTELLSNISPSADNTRFPTPAVTMIPLIDVAEQCEVYLDAAEMLPPLRDVTGIRELSAGAVTEVESGMEAATEEKEEEEVAPPEVEAVFKHLKDYNMLYEG